jgi:hypothetical protein
MGELDPIGNAITGGLVGRAVEPAAGGPAGHSHEAHCLNCGSDLTGPFCSQCGQHAHVHRTLSAFFHDFLHGVLHFESKIWRTLPLLAWRPGELTRRYIDGQRASFVSPIALFLFSVFLMFAVIGLTSGPMHASAEASANAQKQLKQDQQKLSTLKAIRASAKGETATKIDDRIAGLQTEMAALQAVKGGRIDPTTFSIQTRWLGGLNYRLADATKNPELLFYKIKTNAYKFSWALIPISVPFVWLLFPFSRRFRVYDHIVFVTYSLCFMMLLLAASSLIGVVSSSVANVAWFAPPLHMYRQLRGTYDLSKRGAMWRTILLTIFAFIAISLFASLLVMLGVLE